MLLHEGLTHIHSQKKPRLHISREFDFKRQTYHFPCTCETKITTPIQVKYQVSVRSLYNYSHHFWWSKIHFLCGCLKVWAHILSFPHVWFMVISLQIHTKDRIAVERSGRQWQTARRRLDLWHSHDLVCLKHTETFINSVSKNKTIQVHEEAWVITTGTTYNHDITYGHIAKESLKRVVPMKADDCVENFHSLPRYNWVRYL